MPILGRALSLAPRRLQNVTFCNTLHAKNILVLVLAAVLVLTTCDDPGCSTNEAVEPGDCVNFLQKELLLGTSADLENDSDASSGQAIRMKATETPIAQTPIPKPAASLAKPTTPDANETILGRAKSLGKPYTAVSVDTDGQAIGIPAAETLVSQTTIPKAAANLPKPATPHASEVANGMATSHGKPSKSVSLQTAGHAVEMPAAESLIEQKRILKAAANLAKPATPPASVMHRLAETHGTSNEAVSLHRFKVSSSLGSGKLTAGWIVALVVVPVLVFAGLAASFYFAQSNSSASSWDSSSRPTSSSKVSKSKAAGWEPKRGEFEKSFESSSVFDSVGHMDLSQSSAQDPPGSDALDAQGLGLPLVYKPLVLPHVRTRLALPVQPLLQPEYAVDVLGPSGKPVLEAVGQPSAGGRGRSSSVRVMLRGTGSLLVEVSEALQFTSGEGVFLGSLEQTSATLTLRYTFRTSTGETPFVITGSSSFNPDLRDFRIHSAEGRPDSEFARATVRPAGKLPISHYEVTTRPGVDGVMVVACLLAMVSLS